MNSIRTNIFHGALFMTLALVPFAAGYAASEGSVGQTHSTLIADKGKHGGGHHHDGGHHWKNHDNWNNRNFWYYNTTPYYYNNGLYYYNYPGYYNNGYYRDGYYYNSYPYYSDGILFQWGW